MSTGTQVTVATMKAHEEGHANGADSTCTTSIPYYINRLDRIREEDYPLLRGTTYLDHAGTTLYPKSLIDAFSQDMSSGLFGNPHSASTSSQLSTRRVEDIRLRALKFCNADPDHFDLVFVANATAGIKLVMEGFREESGFWYGYHRDSHTSLVGLREAASNGHHCFESDAEVEDWLHGRSDLHTGPDHGGLGLFAYPAQSNMNGRRLPLSWTGQIRSLENGRKFYSLLDAAALVSTSPLDFGNVSSAPDFTVLSFYKIFGFPDLGALIVRKDSASVLQRRRYFGGGTVEMVTCGRENWHIRKQGALHEQFEDGTLPIHSILALDHAMNVHKKLFGSIDTVSAHTSILAEKLYADLMKLYHVNGRQVCKIYNDPLSSYTDSRTQGPVIAFNLQDSQGQSVSNTEVEKLANIRSIHLRSGGLCNPGGTASSLSLQPWEMKRNFSAGYRCGIDDDVVGGKSTGVIRISLGAMSNLQDVTTFVDFIKEFFVDRRGSQTELQTATFSSANSHDHYVETLAVYPIKSCGRWLVPPDIAWDIKEEGLAWDREWCLVHQGTRKALTQKRYPKMALLRPSLDLEKGLLRIIFHGFIPPTTPQEITVPLSLNPSVFQSSIDGASQACAQVCGDDISAHTYSSRMIADFFTTLIGTPCTLARFLGAKSGSSPRHSKAHLTVACKKNDSEAKPRSILLSNESPILTISRSSVNRLNEQIKSKDGKAAHASAFRANIIVAQDLLSSPGLELPYMEDEWRSLSIGQHVTLDVLGGCRRCQMVCVDQDSGEKNEEPFITLAKTRRKEGKVFFGVHTALAAAHAGQSARIQVGDRVVPLSDGG